MPLLIGTRQPMTIPSNQSGATPEYVLGIPVLGRENSKYVRFVILCSVLTLCTACVSFFTGSMATVGLLVALSVSYCGYNGAANNDSTLLLFFSACMIIDSIWAAILISILVFDTIEPDTIEQNGSQSGGNAAGIVNTSETEIFIAVLICQLFFSCAGAFFGQKLLIVLRQGQAISDNQLPVPATSGNVIGASTMHRLSINNLGSNTISQGVALGQPPSAANLSPTRRMSSDNPFNSPNLFASASAEEVKIPVVGQPVEMPTNPSVVNMTPRQHNRARGSGAAESGLGCEMVMISHQERDNDGI